MAKGKKFEGEVIDPNWVAPTASQVEEGGIRPADNGGIVGPPIPAEGNGRAVQKRKAKRGRTDRTYWVCGQKHPADPPRHIMQAPTIGQARKRLEMVRLMPDYSGWTLYTTRETKVA